jgi:hypothetical protein
MITSKMSIGLFLLRVTVNKIHKWIIYVAMFLTVICGLVSNVPLRTACERYTDFCAKGFLLRYPVSMHANQFFLGQAARGWDVHQRRRDHRPHLLVQRHLGR